MYAPPEPSGTTTGEYWPYCAWQIMTPVRGQSDTPALLMRCAAMSV
jgi:hypothetical protein